MIEKIGPIADGGGVDAIDLGGLLVAPGLCDADRPLDEEGLSPIFPGPYLDRARRETAIAAAADFANQVAEPDAWRAGTLSLVKEGATCAAGARRAPSLPIAIRNPDAVWLQPLVLERNPARRFAKAGIDVPVFVPLADGDSRDSARETGRIAEWNMLQPNLIAVGGVGLRADDARDLAAAGAALVWRPLVDEFVLGRTIGADVLRTPGLRLLIGGGSPRDGGKGLLAALRRADRLGIVSRDRLLDAVTVEAGRAFRLPLGVIEPGAWADLSVWRADSFADAVFEHGAAALEMTVVAGQVALCRPEIGTKLGAATDYRTVGGENGWLSPLG